MCVYNKKRKKADLKAENGQMNERLKAELKETQRLESVRQGPA